VVVFISDVTPPVVTFINPPRKTNNAPQLSWRASEMATFECSLNQGPYVSCGGEVLAWSKNNLRDGNYDLSVRGKDTVGNVGRAYVISWVVGKCYNTRFSLPPWIV
jgi:hypothetical protein